MDDDRLFDVKVAACEAAANAVEHAVANVHLWAWILSDRLAIDVANTGRFGYPPPESERNGHNGTRGFGLRTNGQPGR